MARVFGSGVYIENEDAASELVNGAEAVAVSLELAASAARAAREANPSEYEASQIVFGGPNVFDDVACGWFGSTSSIWHIMEFGSINNPPYRPLTTGAERIGLEFKPGDQP
jgi:hypothetical protein